MCTLYWSQLQKARSSGVKTDQISTWFTYLHRSNDNIESQRASIQRIDMVEEILREVTTLMVLSLRFWVSL